MEKENHKLWIQPFPSDIEPNPELVTCVILDFLQFAFHVYLQRVLIRALYLIVFFWLVVVNCNNTQINIQTIWLC